MTSKDPYRYFRIEARQLVEQLGGGLLALERTPDPDGIRTLLRHAHTLKGAARVVRLTAVADRAHAMEELLEPHRDRGEPLETAEVDAALRLLDEIRGLLSGLDGPDETQPAAGESRERRPEPHETVQVGIGEMDGLMQSVLRASMDAHALTRGYEAVAHLVSTAERLAGELAGARDGAPDARALVRRASASAARLRDELVSFEQAQERARALISELDELHHRSSEMRLVSAASIRNDLERAVRDTALASGSSASLAWAGDARVDAHVLRAVREALHHAVRNAVAHGIEPADERSAAGKPPSGLVSITVRRAGYRVWFRCTDDGRGIDAARVREVAVDRQLLTREEAAELDGEGLATLLLRGGVTTARRTTQVSGRGIGLDAVRASVESLGGVVRIESEPFRGTTLELGVPVSLVQLPVLEVGSGAAQAFVPLDAVTRTVRFGRGSAPVPDARGMAVLDGAPVRLLSLSALLRSRELHTHRKGSTAGVLLDTAAGPVLLLVERIGSIVSAIVRPLPRLAVPSAWVGGVMLGPDGIPRVVLAPQALGGAPAGGEPAGREGATAPILIVDDSLTTRMLEQSILESAGYMVELAALAEEALEKVRRATYALLLVDVEMPGMDGFTLLETIAGDASIPDVPSILVTSRDAPADRARGREVGARDYVVKGEFDQEALVRRIEELVR